ncbi:MAG: thioredoxin domain-containing protein [Acidobacteria bacterium]|nr:MAG: thioredoxin domain-containing protein [Acidobacteriota bacterium]
MPMRRRLRILLGLAAALAAAAAAAAPAAPQEAPRDEPAAVRWLPFAPPAFRRALAEDRLILLVLDVPWSPAPAEAERTLWGDPRVRAALAEGYVTVRERADLRPELARRYPAPGWPAATLLLPNGDPLYYEPQDKPPQRLAFGPMPAERLASLLSEAWAFYRTRREEAVSLARERAAAAAKGAVPEGGPLEDALVWSLRDHLKGQFDREHRYFGGPPRLPETDLVSFMLKVSAEVEQPYREMALAALDTLLEHLVDEDGGMYRMALGLDWENPQKEKLLDRNARLLETLALAYRVTGRRVYRDRGLALGRLLAEKFGMPQGAFAAALCPACPEGRDETVLSGPNGLAAAALIRAGAAFGDEGLVKRGLDAARFLLEHRYRKGRGVARAVVGGAAVPPSLLVLDDLAGAAWAFVSAYEVSGEARWLDAARDVARVALSNLKADGTGALADTLTDPRAPGPLRTPLFPLRPNAEMARALVRIFYHNGSKIYRDGAREILRAFAGDRVREHRDMPAFALAAYEYLQPAMFAHVVDPGPRARADALRRAALGVGYPFVLVHTWRLPDDREELLRVGLSITGEPSLALRLGMLRSRQIVDPAGVSALAFDLTEKVAKQKEAIRRQKHPETVEPPPKRRRGGGEP